MRFRHRWISWVSGRFLMGRKGGRGRVVFLFSVILIASGVTTLNTILAVMNGLQQGYIRSILEIGSYHLRWIPDNQNLVLDDYSDNPSTILSNQFLELPSVLVAVPFREGQTMLRGERPRPAGAIVRGVPNDLVDKDKGLAENLEIIEGDFKVSDSGMVIGEELALILGVSPGSTVTALDLGGVGFTPAEIPLKITGIFSCGYREYESSLAFISQDSFTKLFGASNPEIGIKLRNPDRDRLILPSLEKAAEGYNGTISSWRDTNRSFFGALRTEKIMMLLILALVFVVVAVNIDHALRRMVTERKEDLALLKASGATPAEIRLLFLRQGLIIGSLGAFIGSIFGILVGANVDAIMRALRNAWYFISNPFGVFGADLRPFQAHSSEAFFRSSELMLADILIIIVLAVLISSVAALRAAAMAARLNPASVLRSE